MPSYIPPVRGAEFKFPMNLISQADTDVFKETVTLAAGDIQVSKDGGQYANLATFPPTEIDLASGADSGTLWVVLTAAEMTADIITVLFRDAAGAEWQSAQATINTSAQTLDTTDAAVDAVATTIGVAGAGLTALGDTRLANLDATISSRSTLTAAQVWANATRTLSSFGTLVADTAAAVWAYVTRTLTQAAASVTAAVSGSTLNVVKGRTYDATLTGLTIQATWTGVKFTAKTDARDTDAESLLQLVVSNPAAAATDGVLYVEGAAASVAQRLQGTLTVDQAAGTVALHLQDDLTAVLELLSGSKYDITQYYTDGAETKSTQLTRGMWTVSATETAALA